MTRSSSARRGGRDFLAPRHLPDLRELMRLLGADAPSVARLLDVSERTVYHWLKTASAPRAAALALFWETHEGRWIVCDQVERERAIYYRMADTLRSENANLRTRIERLETISDFGCANGPIFSQTPRATAAVSRP